MKIIQLPPISEFGVNSYIIASDNSEGILIDAPGDGREIMKAIEENGIALKKILLTHGHCDHISACAEISRKTGAQVFIHPMDIKKLSNDNTNLSRYFGMPPIEPPDSPIAEDEKIIFGDMEIKILHTPGHTRGSVCYIMGDNMFCGDTLFKNSMGRTDMPDGDEETMLKTLDVLYGFDPDTDYKLFTGHGQRSSMAIERKNNRYMIYARKTVTGDI